MKAGKGTAKLSLAGIGLTLPREHPKFDLPLTQEQLGDVLGLTSVHVNRMLMALRSEGLVERVQKKVTIRDWAGLIRAGDFDETYLHLNSSDPLPLTAVA